MTDVDALAEDLRREGEEADALVADLPAPQWARATPAPGWTIAHQIAHLAWTDRVALLSATDPAAFADTLAAAAAAPDTHVDTAAERGAAAPPAALLAEWRSGRAALLEALARVPAGTRLPWFGPPMKAASMLTARLMETWAHALDIADALGVRRSPTGRLRHVAHLGVRTRDFAFAVHGLDAPGAPFRVELDPPGGGAPWSWGPADAAERVTGPAEDFCLLVVRRRHRADLALRAHGPAADRWLDVAQAFAGPPGTPRPPAATAR
ncbi:TIGR03084 family metal-binding protein [Nocardiopsis trehalosi]|uniref:TIGR03084 family metal-binding protein n=1 Tax=Nocardiopsis trehalosi TaxID=109329 RepID=UPI0008343935|nr:TIGR03084 family metal-binding protein [Nocardiopsis trehalosi]